MVERELPFSARTARSYMVIASSQHLQNGNIVAILPSSWGTLEVLQRFEQAAFAAAVAAEHLQIHNIVTNLPPSWGTLAALARLDRPTFDAAVAARKIHPEMTRADAEALLPARKFAPMGPICLRLSWLRVCRMA